MINKDEIKHAFKKSNSKILNDMNEDKISSMLDEVDYNENNEIDYSEFIAATMSDDILRDKTTLMGLFN